MERWALTTLVLAFAAMGVASCSRKFDRDSFSPTAPEFADALVLSASAASIPADGFSRVAITAQITGEADFNKRQVKFTTDLGDFPANETKSITAAVDSRGSVTVDLRSEKSVSTATVTAQVLETPSGGGTPTEIPGLITRATVEFTQPDPSDIIQLTASSARGEADGASTLFLHADVSSGIPLSDRKVSFTTTLGTFLNGTLSNNNQTTMISADIGLRATATFQSPSLVGEALVTATVADTTVELRLTFDPALPDRIDVKLGAVRLERGEVESTTVEAILTRDPGRGSVTTGTVVHYSAFEKAYGKSLDLVFRNQTPSDADGKSTSDLLLGSVVFVGTATVRASVGDVSGEEDIEIVAPAP